MSPCSDAMIEQPLTISPDYTVEQAMDIFEAKNIRSLPVIDESGKLIGIFGLRQVLFKLLPASVAMEDGVKHLDFLLGASMGIAKRLKKLYPLRVADVMDKQPKVLNQDTTTWEAVRVMALHGSPISVVEEDSNKFLGMVSRQSLLEDLKRLVKEMEQEKNND